MRTAERRGSDARASLAWSTLIWRSRAATSDHRGWTRATRVRSTTAIRGALAARASGGNPGAGFAVIARPEQPARRTASAAQTSGRVISEPSLPAAFAFGFLRGASTSLALYAFAIVKDCPNAGGDRATMNPQAASTMITAAAIPMALAFHVRMPVPP